MTKHAGWRDVDDAGGNAGASGAGAVDRAGGFMHASVKRGQVLNFYGG
jgi:hypothetical protein